MDCLIVRRRQLVPFAFRADHKMVVAFDDAALGQSVDDAFVTVAHDFLKVGRLERDEPFQLLEGFFLGLSASLKRTAASKDSGQ
jgi:hypothetical protein